MKKCPYCGELIEDTDKKCGFCGEWLDNKVIKYDAYKTKARRKLGRVFAFNLLIISILWVIISFICFSLDKGQGFAESTLMTIGIINRIFIILFFIGVPLTIIGMIMLFKNKKIITDDR